MNIDIFILARSASNRLPCKHLREINGKPIIENLVNRMKTSEYIRKVIVCTTDLPSDDKLVNFLDKKNIEYFRGSDKDILKRLLDAAKHHNSDIVIDVSGDKIYTDIDYVEQVSKILQEDEVEFVRGNNSKSIFDPEDHFVHGIIPGGFKVKTLEKICKGKKSKNTEDGYTEFFTSSDTIKKFYIIPKVDFNITKKIKLELDYEEDLDLAKKLFRTLKNDFHMNDILEIFSKNPDLIKITEPIINKWASNYNKQKNPIE
jgi:spore coat polysaccharide biosynthesis protein SpsF